MRDINIQVHNNHTVDFPNEYAGLNLENLQGTITFNFDNFVQGEARAEIVINNEDGYVLLDQVGETYTLPIKSSLLTGDSILMQLVIQEPATYERYYGEELDPNQTYYYYDGTSYLVFVPDRAARPPLFIAETPIWKSEVFFLKVGTSINATTTIPEDYPTWVETLNNLIEQTDNAIEQANNVNIESEQLDDGVKVITTDKNGEQTITIVPQGPQGEPGAPGAVKTIPVETLPTEDIETDAIYLLPMPKIEVASLPATGEPNTIYIVTSTQKRYIYSSNQWIEISQDNNYLEYMYINNNWELIGTMSMQVDLTNYVQFTNYATSAKGGVVKINNDYGIAIYKGELYAISQTYAQYGNKANEFFISKGTLENVITGKGLTTKSYVDGLVGDINSVLDAINGEVI